MIDAEYFNELTEGAERIASDMNTAVVKDVVKRLKARLFGGKLYLTSTDKRQIETLTEAGILLSEVRKDIAQASGLMESEVASLFEDIGIAEHKYSESDYKGAGIDVPKVSQSPNIIRILENAEKATVGEWENLTKTTAASANNTFIREVDRAFNNVQSGTMSISEAYRDSIGRLSRQGVHITYPSGKTDTIEVAVLRALRTGLAQASGAVTAQRAFENGVTCFLTSSHRGARPDHQEWQGEVFWIDWSKMPQGRAVIDDAEAPTGFMGNFVKWLKGVFQKSPIPKASHRERKKYREFVTSTGYGEMLGLCGINCRHTFSPWFEGVSKNNQPQIPKDENDEEYKKQQKQRAMEREIRKTKREVETLHEAMDGLTDPEVVTDLEARYKQAKSRLKGQNEAYRVYCAENGLKPEEMRLYIAGEERKNRRNNA